MVMRSTWWGEIYGRSRGDLGEIQGPPHLLRPRLEPELDARAGIMQPVKNGRTDMPSGVALLEGPPAGASSDGQLQARPAAPDQLQVAPPPPPAPRPRPLALSPSRPPSARTRLTWLDRAAAQALQEAGYLAQMQDAQASSGLSGMATGLSVAGSEMMPPPMGNAGELSSIATLSNAESKPS